MTDFANVRPMGAAMDGSVLRRLLGAVTAWNDRRITRNELARLSDRELEDIGLSRGDIDTVVERLV